MQPDYIETLGCFSDHRNVANWRSLGTVQLQRS